MAMLDRRAAAILAILCLAGCGSEREAPRPELTVFAAASLEDALVRLKPGFERLNDTSVVFIFGGSNDLAHQIEAARRGDVFLSASESWMDYVSERRLIAAGSRRTFLSNRLVIVANRRNSLTLAGLEDLATVKFRHLSLADPEAVPAGQYARRCLEGVRLADSTLWDLLRDRVVPAPDVRAALGLVEAEPDILGMVYRTDAAASDRVRVLFEVPAASTPPIRYSAAVLAGSREPALAARFLAFLAAEEARAVFHAMGFLVTADGSRRDE